MDADEYDVAWRRLHQVAPRSGGPLVSWWLRAMHPLARPLARAGVPPAALTAAGLLLAVAAAVEAAAGGPWVPAVPALVAACALADGLDGAVALINRRTSGWGALLDALTDRVTELVFGVVLWLLGAPAAVAVAAVALAWALEHTRALAATQAGPNAGPAVREVVLTVAERPTRVAVVVMFTLAAAVYPGEAGRWASAGALVWAAVGAIGLAQLLRVERRRLGRRR